MLSFLFQRDWNGLKVIQKALCDNSEYEQEKKPRLLSKEVPTANARYLNFETTKCCLDGGNSVQI